MGRYDALFEEGLIAAEVYDDLRQRRGDAPIENRPRFDLGLDTHRLIARLERWPVSVSSSSTGWKSCSGPVSPCPER